MLSFRYPEWGLVPQFDWVRWAKNTGKIFTSNHELLVSPKIQVWLPQFYFFFFSMRLQVKLKMSYKVRRKKNPTNSTPPTQGSRECVRGESSWCWTRVGRLWPQRSFQLCPAQWTSNPRNEQHQSAFAFTVTSEPLQDASQTTGSWKISHFSSSSDSSEVMKQISSASLFNKLMGEFCKPMWKLNVKKKKEILQLGFFQAFLIVNHLRFNVPHLFVSQF